MRLPRLKGSHDFAFTPKVRILRGHMLKSAQRSTSWIRFSDVASSSLTKNLLKNEDELALFVDSNPSDRFDYVRVACTFHAKKNEAFENVWIMFDFEDSGQAGKVQVWSMFPDASFTEEDVTTTAKLGADLTFLPLKSEVTGSTKKSKRLYQLRSFREALSPYWEMTGTPEVPIRGSYIFHMIVRAPRQMKVTGNVTVEATLRKQTFVMFPKVGEFTNSPSLGFTLGAAS